MANGWRLGQNLNDIGEYVVDNYRDLGTIILVDVYHC